MEKDFTTDLVKKYLAEIQTLKAQNSDMRKALQMWLDEYDRCAREAADIGYSDYGVKPQMVIDSRIALKLSPPRKAE